MQDDSTLSVSTCLQCGSPVPPIKNKPTAIRKYCSLACTRASELQKRYGPDYKFLTRTVRGAVSELIVCADLLARGYEVFRAQSPTCSCDLVVQANGRLFRIEVRSATRNLNGTLAYTWSVHDQSRSDILAAVEPDGRITYVPEIDV